MTQNTLQKIQPTQDNLDLVKNTVAKDATDNELQMFMHLANKYNLDPFAKEIWFIKFKGQSPQIYTSRDGYLKIAHNSGQFDGMESYTVDDNHGNPIKAVCKVFRKDMSRPFQSEIKVNEYKQNSSVWNKYPSAMAIKVAEVFALKRAFTVSGLITKEEVEPQTEPLKSQDIQPSYTVDDHALITEKQRSRLFTIAKSETNKEGLGCPMPRWTDVQIKQYLESEGFESSKDIPKGAIYDKICDYLENHPGQFADVPGQTKFDAL